MGHPWYSFYPADYRNKTAGLTMVQDGAYRRLMDEYYLTGEALPANADILLRICRAFADDEKAAVRYVLRKYFVERDDGWHHVRIDEEIIKRAGLSQKRAIAGSKGASKTNGKSSANVRQPERQLPTQSQSQSQDTSSLRSEVSSEPSGSPPARIEFIRIPTNRFSKNGEEAPIFEDQVVEFEGLFPAVDVRQALRAMRSWSITNTDRRKTLKGMMKFVNRWLSDNQDKGNGQGPGRRNEGKKKTGHDNFFAAGASLIGDYFEAGSAEGGDDCDAAVEAGRPLLPS